MSILLDPMNSGGTRADEAVIDASATASQVSLLKGLLKQLQGAGNGKQPIVNQNSAGSELFTLAVPGQVDVVDKIGRLLGKISAEDGSIVSLGAKSDAAVTDPATAASMVGVLKGLLKQLQGGGVGISPIIAQTTTMTTAPQSQIVTLTETPVLLTTKANLKQITVRNTDLAIRARVGETGMTPANDKGCAIEPGAMVLQEFDPAIAVSLYGRSEGAAVQVEVVQI